MDPSEHPPPPEAPDKEALDKIRQRRLAKLGGSSSNSSKKSSEGSSQQQTESQQAESSTAASSASPATAPQAAPETQTSEVARSARISPAVPTTESDGEPAVGGSSGSSLPQKRPAAEMATNKQPSTSSSPPPGPTGTTPLAVSSLAARRIAASANESIESFADRWLTEIFRVSVDPARTVDVHGHRLTFLPGVSGEMVEAGEPLLLSAGRLDEALLEAGRLVPPGKPLLEYYLPCWKRVVRAPKAIRNLNPEKEEILKEAKRLCMSMCIFSLTMSELYNRDTNDSLVPYLLQDHDGDTGICLDFITEALSRVDEDESILPIFSRAIEEVSQRLSNMTMDDDYKPYINVLLTYVKFPRLVTLIANDEMFLGEPPANAVERKTLLGPFFRISPLQTDVMRNYFAAPRTMDRARIRSTQEALRMTLDAHQDDLFRIADTFVRSGAENRNRLLDWFAYIMNVNHKRRALQVDPREVATDGFMINVTVILDRLCVPFMDNTFGKVDRIDINYLRRAPRIRIDDETKLNADQATADAFYKTKVPGMSNFISEVFFLTLAAHHYGTEATNSKLKNLDKDIKYFERQLAQIEAERHKFINRPDQLALFETTLKRHVEVLERSMSLKFAIEGVLMDEKKMQRDSLLFMRYVAVWLLRVASGSDYIPGKTKLQLPLPQKEPESFSCLPEYALQNIIDNFKFLFSFIPQMLPNAIGEEICALCIALLTSSEYIKNPYLKAKLVTLLYCGTWPLYHYRKGVLGNFLTDAPLANEHLLHALMKFYIECESTGAHTQFYDKFNIRFEIFQVIKCVWDNDVYKRQLTRESKVNRPFFVRFVNLLLNDATYVLDEALTKFPKIHDLQRELRENRELSQEDRDKKTEELQAAEGQAASYMQLANETMAMMKLFTKALSEAFTMPEIVTRLAGMLDYNLETLTGPKSANLKVENPDKYAFHPKTLLGDFIDIYLNLGSSPRFIEAVASDGRSYKPEILDKASRILESKNIKNTEELQAWNELKQKFLVAKIEMEQAEVDLGEIPEDFEDPILGILMEDPVILPSGKIVDRSTIVQHLLSDPKDPFTRQPMTMDDAKPATELLERIKSWKAERLAAARAEATQKAAAEAAQKAAAEVEAEAAAATDGEPMDTTA